ncbi:unnamed protein product [Bursaphelenchus xylophilus]|uniref:(pine wood nematode) hypothetical protein n=1 Tax=Bursaphelenchus xylophilus TaxID=6326 RepID=A0A1I7S2D2_BURXY|nr:unnamed protein product [Bursaphelenchus xylophilus]CAG9114657.1 unnamed protein product [Bursaphelenchus xylophilus]
MESFWTVLLGLVFVANSEIIKYIGEAPIVDIKFKKDDNVNFSVIVELESPSSFVLGKECAKSGTCTRYNHKTTYDSDVYGATFVEEVSLRYDNANLEGKKYRGYLETPLGPSATTEYNIVVKTSKPIGLAASGVIGLENRETMKQIFAGMDKTKELTFRRGPFTQFLQKQRRYYAHGEISTNGDKLGGCGTFVYQDTIDDKWKIRADVKIGEKSYPNRKITFNLGYFIAIPKQIQAVHYNDIKDPEKIPSLSITFQNTEFKIPPKNFVQYFDHEHKELTVYTIPQADGIEDFELGENFLSDFCISLKTNEAIDKFELGLAPSEPLDSDSKWIDYPGDDDDKGKASAKTCLNLSLIFVAVVLKFWVKEGTLKIPYDSFQYDEYPLTFFANALDPNPDNVQWVAGNMIFQEYCVTLDYVRNTTAFAKLIKR